jgi:ethanolamine ammonia-lyase small subunit
VLRTAAQNRDEYLRRPDRGRQLSEDSALSLSESCASCKYAFVIADGLSALAIHRHAVPLLELVFAGLDWKPDQNCPIFIVEQGRVAIGDAIGEAIQSDLSVVFIGERPGLSSPDSLGVYLTWAPRNGRTDGERNCISNIHANGLSYAGAAHKLLFLIKEAQRRKLTGVTLKETAGQLLSMENGQRSISD